VDSPWATRGVMPYGEFDVNGVGYDTSQYAKVSFDGDTYRNYYTDYEMDTEYGLLDAFCVQSTDAPSGSSVYELLKVIERLEAAAWVADQYWNGSPGFTKEVAQIAIWELALDWNSEVNLEEGNFRYLSGSDYDDIDEIVKAAMTYSGLNVLWAHNPVGEHGYDVGSQDYLVQNSVPEPSMMLLMGTGLIGLAGVCRRQFFKA
jgi:hypothetical protein